MAPCLFPPLPTFLATFLALALALPLHAESPPPSCRLPGVHLPGPALSVDQLTMLSLCRFLDGTPPLASFTVEIADDAAERAQGLMGRQSMPEDHGMLFAYPAPRPVAFWMHDTPLPLDMLFIDAQGMVVNLHENARPFDETPIPSGLPVRYVLEINGGLAARLGLRPGLVVPQLAALAP